MHKRLYVQCELEFQLTAKSPILVQGTQQTTGAATFHQTRDPTDPSRPKYCIPGTSLKGVWRNASESILRTFHTQLACDPFETKKGHPALSCSERLKESQQINTSLAYKATCPACRLFGSTIHASLMRLNDCWAVGDPQPERQTGIAIDRFTGGVKTHALYSYEPLPAGTVFTAFLTIDNVEFWQLGLLALVSREMTDGRVRLGSGTRKGLGHVEVDWKHATFRYATALYEPAWAALPPHAGRLASAQHLALSDDQVKDQVPEQWLLPDLEPQPTSSNWADTPWTTFSIDDAHLRRLQADCVATGLKPKLESGPAGFAYQPPAQREADHV